jgi:hypothetical protein
MPDDYANKEFHPDAVSLSGKEQNSSLTSSGEAAIVGNVGDGSLRVEGINTPIPAKDVVMQMTSEQVEALIRKVIAENPVQGDFKERATITLLVQEQVKKLLNPEPAPRIFVHTNDPWAQFKEGMASVPEKTSDGQKLRYGNTRPDAMARRRSQGYEPVLDESGNQIRVGDMVLLKISKEKHEKVIAEPLRARREARRSIVRNLAESFHETGRRLGVKTSGDITYDSKE